jgi:hypothetical protein
VTVRSTAYVDETGRPKLRPSIVGFIDILGFSHASTTKLDESQQTLERIFDAIEDSRAFVRQTFPESAPAGAHRWGIKFFSDNLALGYPLDETIEDPVVAAQFILRCTQQYQLRMAFNGYFLRGALTQGSICLTDEMIFGAALVECYQLESKASIVPRVILAEPLRDLLMSAGKSNRNESNAAMRDPICRDVDGWWFVNYLEAARDENGIHWDFVERHKQSILNCLSATTRHDVLPKFGWACRYHNVFCHWHRDDPAYSDRYHIDRVDERSTISRLSDLD